MALPAAPTTLEALLRQARRAIVLGVGGGGDVVGTIPTARLLELFGISCVLGGLSWERFVYDPQPGTRTLAEVEHVQPLAPTVWLANAQTATRSGVRFAESEVAAFYNTETLLVDLSQGVAGVVAGLRAARQALQADLLVGIDVGGDSLARGHEAGLRSPLADAMMLAAFYQLSGEVSCLWGVFGYGSDAELTPAEIDQALSLVARHGGLLGAWGLTPAVVAELERLLAHVRTEASAIAVACARGATGVQAIRDGTRRVALSPVCTITFYLSPQVLYEQVGALARAVAAAPSLAAASAALAALGVRSEYEFEKEMLRRGVRRYDQA
ncbi:MAG: hypothetical protein KatS3mg131_0076 [Candidatus Tectimicrobiota bacterium]|nr:MAG: hypothetical protein KatS3mg131_0076 [Candidatus Tectomicrobia bacterium]